MAFLTPVLLIKLLSGTEPSLLKGSPVTVISSPLTAGEEDSLAFEKAVLIFRSHWIARIYPQNQEDSWSLYPLHSLNFYHPIPRVNGFLVNYEKEFLKIKIITLAQIFILRESREEINRISFVTISRVEI